MVDILAVIMIGVGAGIVCGEVYYGSNFRQPIKRPQPYGRPVVSLSKKKAEFERLLTLEYTKDA